MWIPQMQCKESGITMAQWVHFNSEFCALSREIYWILVIINFQNPVEVEKEKKENNMFLWNSSQLIVYMVSLAIISNSMYVLHYMHC